MATIHIDGKPYEVAEGQNLLEACISLRLNVPYFCWHPAMGSAGACRQCAVKQYQNAEDTRGRIVMSCMTPVQNGQRFTIEDDGSKEFRASVIEFLMTNHPHDCPICDEGGECHLQDMTLMSGHDYREYRFDKRTYKNQQLGPFINHEMNRCIQCYRCVRFYDDYAGGEDLAAFASKNHVYFGRHEDGTLESEFSGNLVEVCPTGVFTDKSLKTHYTRRWDLQMAPSVCMHCAVGCNTIPGERYGAVRRIRNRYNGEVNGFFLCDRGRYGYEFVNGEKRVRQALRRTPAEAETNGHGPFEVISKADALAAIGPLLADRSRVIGIGSPRASLESNFALRELVGADRYSCGVAARECALMGQMLDILRGGPISTPSLREIGESEAVFILGEDLLNVAPMMALQVRQAIRNIPLEESRKAGIPDWNDLAVRELLQDKKGPLYSATVDATKLDDAATRTYIATPGDIARLGFAVANAIDNTAPAVNDLAEDARALAAEIAAALRGVRKATIISGPSLGSSAVIQAAANVALALQKAGVETGLAFTAPEVNSVGVALLGGSPIEEAVGAVTRGEADTVIILENDLYRRLAPAQVERFLNSAKNIVVIGHTRTATADRADFVLPADTFAEGDGTVVSSEGRAQRFFQVYMPEGDIQESWRWAYELSHAAGHGGHGAATTLDIVLERLAAQLPQFARIPELMPNAEFRIGGRKIPRQSHRYSGRTAMKANVSVVEQGVPQDPDSSYAFTMEGFMRKTPPALVPAFWSPGWNSPQAVTRFQEEIGGSLRGGDPGMRLIEANVGALRGYFTEIPAVAPPASAERIALPLYHIFGSEELSALSPPVAERSPMAYVALNAEDAEALQVMRDGDSVEIILGGETLRLPTRLRPQLPKGCVGLPVGLGGQPLRDLPMPCIIQRGSTQ